MGVCETISDWEEMGPTSERLDALVGLSADLLEHWGFDHVEVLFDAPEDKPLYYDSLQNKIHLSLDICMFHIALPTEGHPTRALLDALVDASGRGVRVRVLIDRDRKGDPYGSLAVNKPAFEYLQARNVPCRYDRDDRLLHSKFVVIDRTTAILGSHNWSAGSYFQFDDVSVLVTSAACADQLTARLDILWSDLD